MSEELPKPKVNKWDGPSEEDIFGREPFVDTIVKTIQSSDEGFNLGISARWGEGKSSILKQLQPKLELLDYKVLTFEPWKYTQDSTSIKRKFLIDIYDQLGKVYDDSELYGSTEKTKDLKPDEYQELLMDRLRIFARLFFNVALLFLGVLFLFEKIFWDINITQIFLSNLFIPVLGGIYPLVTKLAEVNIKQSIPKVESAEQFEKRFNESIEEIMKVENPPKRIIIFVDDLDRCNHTEVEQILTALFTFFNNKHCTYIITADHTVIRRYISHFLQLEDILDDDGKTDMKKTVAMRQKEATEYLKKIFQINFIVPKISSDLLEKMIKDLLMESPIIDSKNPYGKDYLVNMILNNFQGNPRKIKHFIRTLAFQLEAINEKINSIPGGEEERNNLVKVKNSPELLAKILIIQDRFPDFYEQIVSEPKLLQRHEEGDLAGDKDLQNVLAQEPRFFNSVTRPDVVKTIDPYYFLYFSGSTGYIEAKAVDPAEIKALAKSADFSGLAKLISGLTDEPRNAQVEFIKKEFDAPEAQLPEKVNIVRSLFHVVGLIEEPVIRLQKLKNILSEKIKYKLEFGSLQSVDFDKFLSFADIEVVSHVLTEAPFNTVAIQTQVLEAFANKQKEISKGEITDRFIQTITEGIKRNDANSTTYLNIAKKISPENFSVSDDLQDVLVETYANAIEPLKQEIFDALMTFKLSAPAKVKLETILLTIIEKNSISEAVSVIGNIPTKINKGNFDLYKLVSVANKRIETSNHPETEQMVNILIHPAVSAEIGTQNTDRVFENLIEVLHSTDVDKKSYVRGKLPDFISQSGNKAELLKRIVKAISTSPVSESLQTMSVVQGMSDFWNDNPKLKNSFAEDLKKVSREVKDKEVKDLMVKSSNEMVPLPEPKKNKTESSNQ